jgi:hypothetical protein
VSGVPRSQRLLYWAATAAQQTGPAWVCPDNTVTLVKTIHSFNPTAIAADALVLARVPTANNVLLAQFSVPANQATTWNGWIVLNPGDAVWPFANAAGQAFWFSGAVLMGGPQFPPATRDSPAVEPNR